MNSGNTPVKKEGRWGGLRQNNSDLKEEGFILLTSDKGDVFKATSTDNDAIGTRLNYLIENTTNSAPRRGDLVSFTRCKQSKKIKDIRVIKKSAASVVKGHLEKVDIMKKTAVLVPQGNTSDGDTFDVSLDQVVSCSVKLVKEKESVEGIIWNGKVVGVCRASDLYLDTKLERKKERPKLNLTVKRDRGGKIVAQSSLAKGPDGGNGFRDGWTKRVSSYNGKAAALNVNAKAFIMGDVPCQG